MWVEVNEIFQSIQGEGVNAGIPMTFVRLQGCSVGCPWCDTKHTWVAGQGTRMSVEDVVAAVNSYDTQTPWVCITGGEPAEVEAPRMDALVRSLHAEKYQVCVETSGVAGVVGSLLLVDWLTLSPKGHLPPSMAYLKAADEMKVVVCTEADVKRTRELAADLNDGVPVLLQPVAGSKKAETLCAEACMKYGWRLSLQLHKYLGLR